MSPAGIEAIARLVALAALWTATATGAGAVVVLAAAFLI